jgi:hypothetical protein
MEDKEKQVQQMRSTFIHHFKVSPFWLQNQKMWFIQLESSFVTANITDDETMSHYVVNALDGGILKYVSDILENPLFSK